MDCRVGDWVWSTQHGEAGQVVAVEELWGLRTLRLWLPTSDSIVRVMSDAVASVGDRPPPNEHDLSFVAAASRIADALSTDALLAPVESKVIPLPHQLHALSRAMSGDRVRFLLADEVGLGKTIEAGLIMRELKLRGLVERILVIAPAGLVTQWVAEMRTHFTEEFQLVVPGEMSSLRRLHGVDEGDNLWRRWNQVVCPMDSVKPMDRRKGWSFREVQAYNRERFVDMIAAGWDLIVIDEAHRMGGSSEQVARYKLGEALSEASPYLLLLSATPHQGKTDGFRRLMTFLDKNEFIGDDAMNREKVAPYVIRTEKRVAIDADGNPLFKPRFTQLHSIEWGDSHAEQRALYDAVTEYVREGYNQAMAEKNTAIGFLMILMQRLVTSSTRAIRVAMERRLEVLTLPKEQLGLFPEDIGAEWAELDSQEQLEEVLKTRLKALKNERQEVELLLSAARRCEARGPDIKAKGLLEKIQELQREENDPDLKVLIFTEFVPTQEMLAEFLEARGYSTVSLNGSLGMDERQNVQQAFREKAQVLISTDAGGEGLNLQFCHVIVNFDLPWNPMKLEQRIGRVDRIGQGKVVRAINFALDGTVELRVREVLEQKLQVILEEFGVDKLSDVLDSEEGGVPFEELFRAAVMSPEDAEARAERLAQEIRSRAEEARAGSKSLGAVESLSTDQARQVANHQLPYWTERMVVSFLNRDPASGTRAVTREGRFDLRWPDGVEQADVVFDRIERDENGGTVLTVEDRRVRQLLGRLPSLPPGGVCPVVGVDGVSDRVSGWWSLWRVSLQSEENREQRLICLFVDDAGKVLGPTAKSVWDAMIDGKVRCIGMTGVAHTVGTEELRRVAAERGESIFRDLASKHQERVARERRKGQEAFRVRRKALDHVGLEAVRQYRLRQLGQEESGWQERIERRSRVVPELSAVGLVRVGSLPEGTGVT
jgi:superfamily II DNA or RNA helicase